MSDWDREDEDDAVAGDPAAPLRPPAEGVRIIGAEEAAAALETGQVAGRRPDDEPRFGDVPVSPEGPRPAHRFPLPDHTDPTEVAPRPPLAATPVTPMQHWTEPPTGEIPRVLAGSDPAGDDEDEFSAWSPISRQPRWRDEHSAWDDFDDASVLADADVRIGALDSTRTEHSDLFDFNAEPVPAPVQPAAAYEPEEPLIRTRSGVATRKAPRRPAYGSEVGEIDAPSGGGRDVNAAVITGLVVAGLALLLFKLGPGWAMLIVVAVVTLAAAELFDVLRRSGYQPATLLGLAATVGVLYAAYEKGERALPLSLFLTAAFSFLWYLFGVTKARATVGVAATVLGFVWVGIFGSFAALMLGLGGDGVTILLATVLATAAADIGAYVAGSQFGGRPLAPEISPNKTVEGLIGGVFTSVIVTMLFIGYLPGAHPFAGADAYFDRGDLFLFALVLSLVAPLGDLAESMIKRDLGIKDTSSILPGHGGVLDRFDAMLFTLPTAYYLLQVLA